MKRALLGIIATSLLFSCSKNDSEETGTVSVNVSYKVNDTQGSKPDAGASAYLYRQTGKQYNRVYIDYKIGY